MRDQFSVVNPVDAYHTGAFVDQPQSGAGLAREVTPTPDHGERTYRGTGRLAGRKALITGAESGIGRAVAIAFAREGADVVLAYRSCEQTGADEVAGLVREAGRVAVLVPADIAAEAEARSLVRTAVRELDGLDIVVNAAGQQQPVDDLIDLTTEQFDETFKTNVYALFWIVQEALPHLPPGSSIITTSSIQAYAPSPSLIDYAATKTAINTFSKALAQQVAERGIRVNVVAPGPVWGPLQTPGGQPTEALPQYGLETPLGRAGQPAEFAPAYVFLASAESGYVTGETLNINGGMPTP